MIEIVPYKPRWPTEFESVKQEIIAVLGDAVISVDHIGSTSVPGLAAKDIIDIQLTVSDFALSMEAPLNSLGFGLGPHTRDHAPPGLDVPPQELEKRYYKNSIRPMHLHVRKPGAFNQRYALLFRDYLRASPLACAAYGEIKKALARKCADDIESYSSIKDPVCDAIMAGAYRWAEEKSR